MESKRENSKKVCEHKQGFTLLYENGEWGLGVKGGDQGPFGFHTEITAFVIRHKGIGICPTCSQFALLSLSAEYSRGGGDQRKSSNREWDIGILQLIDVTELPKSVKSPPFIFPRHEFPDDTRVWPSF